MDIDYLIAKSPTRRIGDQNGRQLELTTAGAVPSQLVDAAGNPISSVNPLDVRTRPSGVRNDNNSTTTPLLAGASFVGTATDVSDYAAIGISIASDQASALKGLKVYYSADGLTDWELAEEYSFIAGSRKFYTPTMQNTFMKVEYENGAIAQTTFHIHTLLWTSPIKWSSHNISEAIVAEDDAELMLAVLTGLTPSGLYKNVNVTNAGNLKTSLEEYESTFDENPLPVTDPMLHIARGNRLGVMKVNKYGEADDGIQITPTDIWDRADSAATQQIWLAPTAARIHTLVSTSAADDGTPEGAGAGAQAVRVWYLPDWDTAETFEDVILNGLTGVAMLNAAVIIHRMKVIPVGTTYAINVGDITAAAAVDATVTAQISAGNGQTEMAIYGIPSTQTAYMTNWLASAHSANTPASPTETDFVLLVNEYPNLNTTAFINKSNIGTIATGTSSVTRRFQPYKDIAGPAIIKVQGTASVADTDGVAEFDLIVVDNVVV